MTEVVLLTATDCHLCARGRAVLNHLAVNGLVRWREVDDVSDEGRVLAAAAPPLRPVLLDPDARVIAYGRFSERRLRRQLAAHIPSAQP